jgi:hypothetical protein
VDEMPSFITDTLIAIKEIVQGPAKTIEAPIAGMQAVTSE